MKRKVKLTKVIVQTLKLPDGKDEKIFWDAQVPGFGLRVRKNDLRTLIFQYFRPGPGNKIPKIKIGDVGAIAVDEARTIAKKYYARVQLGEDLARDKAVAKQQASQTSHDAKSRTQFSIAARVIARGSPMRLASIRASWKPVFHNASARG